MSVDEAARWVEAVRALVANPQPVGRERVQMLQAVLAERPEGPDPMHDWLWLRLVQIQHGDPQLAKERAAALFQAIRICMRPHLDWRLWKLNWPPPGDPEGDLLRLMLPGEP